MSYDETAMILKLGRTYNLLVDNLGKSHDYHMRVLEVTEEKYFFSFTCLWENDDAKLKVFEVDYDKESVHECIDTGTWKIELLIPPNQFDNDLFTMEPL